MAARNRSHVATSISPAHSDDCQHPQLDHFGRALVSHRRALECNPQVTLRESWFRPEQIRVTKSMLIILLIVVLVLLLGGGSYGYRRRRN